jgi:hypothetical protein
MQPTTQYVLRLEHKETQAGPYVHFKAPEGLEERLGIKFLDTRPQYMPPLEADLCHADSFEFQRSTHVCGVEYMSQLYDWFGANLMPFYEAGFKLYLYLMPAAKVLRGESGLQVAFNKADALEVMELA